MPRKPKKARIFVSTAPKKTLGQKVTQIINSKSETKSHEVYQQFDLSNNTPSTSASLIPIGLIGKVLSFTRINVGDRNGFRVGDKINPTSFDMSYSLVRNPKAPDKSVQQVRVTLYRTYNRQEAPPDVDGNGGTLPDTIQQNWNLANVDVLYDAYHTLTENQMKVDVNNKVFRRMPKIYYSDNTPDGCRRGNFYIRFQAYAESDQASAPHFSLRSRLKYKDF